MPSLMLAVRVMPTASLISCPRDFSTASPSRLPRCASARPRRDREISLDAQTIAKSDKHHDAHPRLAEMRIRPATSAASTRSVCSSTSVLLRSAPTCAALLAPTWRTLQRFTIFGAKISRGAHVRKSDDITNTPRLADELKCFARSDM